MSYNQSSPDPTHSLEEELIIFTMIVMTVAAAAFYFPVLLYVAVQIPLALVVLMVGTLAFGYGSLWAWILVLGFIL